MDDRPRCFFSLFGFGTNLVGGDDWLIREGNRFRQVANKLSIPPEYVDRLVVMDRGIINCAEGKGHDSAKSGQNALQIWFVHLINHLLREDQRRKEIDIDIYTGGDRWMALPAWKDVAPSPVGRKTVSSPVRRVRKTASGGGRDRPRGAGQQRRGR